MSDHEEVEFLTSEDSPEIGPFMKGERKTIPSCIAEVLVERDQAKRVAPVTKKASRKAKVEEEQPVEDVEDVGECPASVKED